MNGRIPSEVAGGKDVLGGAAVRTMGKGRPAEVCMNSEKGDVVEASLNELVSPGFPRCDEALSSFDPRSD